MEILNRREQLKATSIPPEIVNPSTLVTTSDKATKSKAGIVKIGDGINVSNGVISVANSGGAVIELPDFSLYETGTEITEATVTAINTALANNTPIMFIVPYADNSYTYFVHDMMLYEDDTGETPIKNLNFNISSNAVFIDLINGGVFLD